MPFDQTNIPVPMSEAEHAQLLNEEHLGNWWLPENPERRIPETLSFDRDHRASLDLMEAFEVTFDRQMQLEIDYPLIFGQDRSAKKHVMVNCWKDGGTINLSSGRSWSTIRSQQVLMDLPDEFGTSLSLDSFELQNPNFSQWWTSGASPLSRKNSAEFQTKTSNTLEGPEYVLEF